LSIVNCTLYIAVADRIRGGIAVHIFLQGQRNAGKSIVIEKTLEILSERKQLLLGGFFTWNGGNDDPHVYMRPAAQGREDEVFRIASYRKGKGGMACDIGVLESEGVRLVQEGRRADLIVMDELGYLEINAPEFRQAVMGAVSGGVPILGVLRLGDVPWHAAIKRSSSVRLYDVDDENRDALPQKLANILLQLILQKNTGT